jgi:acetyl-CoA carboxylase, biotin carboxylase subunit
VFHKVLVANRGEIAVRIVRACHDLGIRAVVAYSEADRYSLAVRMADEAVCIGPAPAARSYLNPSALISAARITGCEAVHPGYGFLSENPYFADICAECQLQFIGPSGDAIRRMGDKALGR